MDTDDEGLEPVNAGGAMTALHAYFQNKTAEYEIDLAHAFFARLPQ